MGFGSARAAGPERQAPAQPPPAPAQPGASIDVKYKYRYYYQYQYSVRTNTNTNAVFAKTNTNHLAPLKLLHQAPQNRLSSDMNSSQQGQIPASHPPSAARAPAPFPIGENGSRWGALNRPKT